MSEIEPRVIQSQNKLKLKAGRGFSLGEIKGAGLDVHEAKRLSLRIDRRRKTTHDANITTIKTYIKQRKEKLEKRKEEEAKEKPLKEAEKQAVSELTKIEGLNKKLAKKLFEIKIDSLDALSSARAKDIAKKIGVSDTRAKLWIQDAEVLTGKVKPEPELEPELEAEEEKEEIAAEEVVEEIMKEEVDLTKIKSLTKEDAKKLAEIGILTVEDLAEEEEVIEVAEITGIPKDLIKVWIQEAKKLTKTPKEAAKPKKDVKAPKKTEKPTKPKKEKSAKPKKAKKK
ncbi:MAG: ribosomal protein L13e [Candidatus Jordarchaeum sp.]|uniref:ribosomal protein L13e n=1 Tax=Candidatus Jordarchaeum sp. TaxID=2823881 RepID=UPI0040494AE1